MKNNNLQAITIRNIYIRYCHIYEWFQFAYFTSNFLTSIIRYHLPNNLERLWSYTK